MTTQISPISAAQHYATSAAFWESQAKLLRGSLDVAEADVAKLRNVIVHGSEDDLATARQALIAAELAPTA